MQIKWPTAIDELPSSNVSLQLSRSQRELLRHKQEARHLQAIKVNLKLWTFHVGGDAGLWKSDSSIQLSIHPSFHLFIH